MKQMSLTHLGQKALILVGLMGSLALAGCGGGSGITALPGGGRDYDSAPRRPVKHSEALDYSKNFTVHGIDVSKYQGNIDWQAVASSGTQFAWIKATEGGDHVDQKFRQNWEGAKAAGVPRGAYHFVYWCRPWQEEMNFFKQVVPVDPGALPPVLDVEATPTSKTCKRRLERDSALAEMKAMLVEMERHYGKRPVIYTTVDFYEAILHSNALDEYPIWVRSTKHHPNVRYGDRHWTFWQYQSDGTVAGIGPAVDRNVFRGSMSEWKSWLAKN